MPAQDLRAARDMTRINVPEELIQEIDLLAGANQRSAYVVNVLWKEIRRTRQRDALRDSAGAWKLGEAPELVYGGAAFVEESRSERDERFENTLDRHCADDNDSAGFLGNL